MLKFHLNQRFLVPSAFVKKQQKGHSPFFSLGLVMSDMTTEINIYSGVVIAVA